MRKRVIAIITGSRATYGYTKRLMQLIRESPAFELRVVVTGMHLLKQFGASVNEIERDGQPIAARVDMVVGGDSPTAWAKSLGLEIISLAQTFDTMKPDLVVVEGDRGEMLAATITAAYMNIPVAHIQAGDVTGHIDDAARHAITKLCHLHLASCEESARRLARMGEEPWRIHTVGAPQLDAVVRDRRLSREEVAKRFKLDLKEPALLVLQHPVLVELDQVRAQMVETMEAVKATRLQAVVVYPNVDAGGEEIINVVRGYESPRIQAHRNLDRPEFLSLLPVVSALVGNSSCGILEAPSFKLPAVNIGNRERGRTRASNVIDVPEHDRAKIQAAITRALKDQEYRRSLEGCVNPYGDGHSSERICKILEEVELGPRLLDKRITF